MHLSSLVLRGFKSFASATTLSLEPGITCVVGPNGSGKSNVVDAIAWVMGEQGAKSLRGGAMQDVIFAGTAGTPTRAARPALGRAEVALTIDNSDGTLPVSDAEVTISRTMFRSGGSEYAINGSPARLLDVQELLSDAGIGREMHVIVGQGQLDAVLHATPQERRALVEEAAGVLKHRRRKERTLRKLDAMGADLVRLADLAAEVRRQLGPLGRQAEVARRALGVQADARDARGRLLADDLVQLEATLAADVAAAGAASARRGEVAQQLTAARAAVLTAQAGLDDAQRRAGEAGEAGAAASALRERVLGTATLAAERARSLLAEADAADRAAVGDPSSSPHQMRSRAQRQREQEAALTARVARTREELAQEQRERRAAEEALAAHERATASAAREAADRRERLASSAGQLAARRSALDAALAEADRRARAQEEAGQRVAAAERSVAEHAGRPPGGTTPTSGPESPDGPDGPDSPDALAALEEELDGAERALAGARGVEREAERDRAGAAARCEALELALSARRDGTAAVLAHGGLLPGVRGPLADALRVRAGHEDVVAAALSHLADAVVVDSVGSAVDVLRHLHAGGRGGRVELVVAPEAAGGTGRARRAAVPDGAQAVVDLVDVAPGGVLGVLHRLLAGYVAVEDLTAARALVAARPHLTAVTEAGDVLGAGAARGGGGRGGAQTLLHVSAAREEAEAALRGAGAAAAAAHEQLQAAGAAQAQLRGRVEDARSRLRALDAEAAQRARAAGELAGALRVARAELARVAESATRSQLSLSAAREAAARAQAAHEGLAAAPLDGRGLPEHAASDAETRAALAAAAGRARTAEVEARLSLRTGEERLRPLAGRADALEAAADREELERARALAVATRRREAAVVAAAAGSGAQALLLRVQACAALAHDRRSRALAEQTQAQAALAAAREGEQALLAEAALLAQSDHRIEVARAEVRLRLEALRARSLDELGTDPDVLVEELGPHHLVPSTCGGGADEAGPALPYVRAEQEQRLHRAERDLARLGRVNPLALEEFAALEERSAFLTDQLEDLRRSKADLLGIVAEVDARVEEVFAQAYAAVAQEFTHVFARLFPGGEGALVLTDPGAMLTSGIEVEARPAGKRVKRLSLLSGGERALAAVALLIAVFTARPSPFYVLDEVEAALDEANLRRLLTVLEELRASSQLLVITHQERTMEIADALYGVTMRGDGVSTVVSQRLHRSPAGPASAGAAAGTGVSPAAGVVDVAAAESGMLGQWSTSS